MLSRGGLKSPPPSSAVGSPKVKLKKKELKPTQDLRAKAKPHATSGPKPKTSALKLKTSVLKPKIFALKLKIFELKPKTSALKPRP